jgi:cytochrome b subunit of formate dehydrogenase
LVTFAPAVLRFLHQHVGVVFFVWWTFKRWWRKRRTAGANVFKTAGQVERNHNSGTAGRYNINKEDTNTWSGQVDDA